MITITLPVQIDLDVLPETRIDLDLLKKDLQACIEVGLEGAPDGVMQDVVQVLVVPPCPEGLLEVEARALNAWVDFRLTHDLEDAKVKCCERTQELFAALQSFENHVRGTNNAPRR